MNTRLFMAGIGAGAAAMFFLDPDSGRRRRARARDAAVHGVHVARRALRRAARDIEHRAQGMAVRLSEAVREEEPPPDDVLVQRVRARLGRLVSHPHAIKVSASRGHVTLSGPIFQSEVAQLLEGVKAVPGVIAVENRLEPHSRDAAHVPALQGAGPRKVSHIPPSLRRWTPAARVAAGIAGLALLGFAAPQRRPLAAVSEITAAELLERALLGTRARP